MEFHSVDPSTTAHDTCLNPEPLAAVLTGGASESSISTLLGAHFLHVSELIDYVWKTPGDLD